MRVALPTVALILALSGNLSASVAQSISQGSGFFITDDGFFVTAHHVVKEARQTWLVLPDRRTVTAIVVGTDVANDLAILKAEGSYSSVPIANSRVVRRGMSVMTVGYPNLGIQGSEPKVTRGIVNSLSGLGNDPRVFQVDLPIQPGNSGGPLVLETGYVVGVVMSRLSDLFALKRSGSLPQNVNYAVKANYLAELVSTVPGLAERTFTKPPAQFTNLAELTAFVERATAIVVAPSGEMAEPVPKRGRPPPQRGSEPPMQHGRTEVLGGVGFTESNGRVTVTSVLSFAKTTLLVGDRLWRCAYLVGDPVYVNSLTTMRSCKFPGQDKGTQSYVYIVIRSGKQLTKSVLVRNE